MFFWFPRTGSISWPIEPNVSWENDLITMFSIFLCFSFGSSIQRIPNSSIIWTNSSPLFALRFVLVTWLTWLLHLSCTERLSYPCKSWCQCSWTNSLISWGWSPKDLAPCACRHLPDQDQIPESLLHWQSTFPWVWQTLHTRFYNHFNWREISEIILIAEGISQWTKPNLRAKRGELFVHRFPQ